MFRYTSHTTHEYHAMNADIVEQMRTEEADLVRKLQAVRDFLAAYGEPPRGGSRQGAKIAADRPTSGPRAKVPITSFTESTRTSVALSLMMMATNNGLIKTSDLVTAVEAMGHEISGSNKVNALGALLARSEDVEGHGKSGWAAVDRERALSLARRYASNYLGDDAQNENEPEGISASGSDAGKEGAPTPPNPWTKLVHGPAS